jgi:hypothetical protein
MWWPSALTFIARLPYRANAALIALIQINAGRNFDRLDAGRHA